MNAHETLGRLLNDPRVKVTLSINELLSCGNALRVINEDLAAKSAEITELKEQIAELNKES